jgi:hypothetical protein
VTVTGGTNVLTDAANLKKEVLDAIGPGRRRKTSIDLWDGKTAERTALAIETIFNGQDPGARP